MEPINIRSPVRGVWSFMNPPGHHPDAKDFVAVNNKGKPYTGLKLLRHLFYKLNVKDTYSWEKEIFSPFDGKVVKVEHEVSDRIDLNLFRDLINGLVVAPRSRKNGIDYFLGNYVVLVSSEGIYSLFAHLRQDSVVVHEGESVEAGQLIGKVGNSGNTIQPHLHFQLMREHDVSRAIPLPFIFESCQTNNAGAWESLHSKLPGNYEKFRV